MRATDQGLRKVESKLKLPSDYAIFELRRAGISLNSIADMFEIPRATFHRRLQKRPSYYEPLFNVAKFSGRFHWVRHAFHLSQPIFGEQLGFASKVVAALESGKLKPTGLHKSRLVSRFGLNREWIDAGVGDPFFDWQKNRLCQSWLMTGRHTLPDDE
jgi:hypothetical protein